MIAMRQIRQIAERIARDFRPERIILFGSYAHGSQPPIQMWTCWS